VGTPRTRREFLRDGALLGTAVAAGASVLSACAGTPMPSRAGPDSPVPTTGTVPAAARAARPTLDAPELPSGLLRIDNRPGLIGQDTVRDYQLATGVTVDYFEDVLDDDNWLSGVDDELRNHQDLGADLVILGDQATTTLLDDHHLLELEDENVPNRSHLRRQLADPAFDQHRRHSLPWIAGMAGIAYHPDRVAAPVRGVGDLFDPRYKGRVTMLSDLRDGLGMVMQYQDNSPAAPSTATVTQAAARVHAAVAKGQIARFTGNADFADLVSGAVVMAQVRSGDMAGLRAANPRLAFVVPESGSTLFSRNMVVPDTTHNQVAAESWMNWIYDRDNYAAMIDQVRATAVLSDLGDELARISPELATDPLVNPPSTIWSRLAVWAPLDPTTEAQYTALYASVTR
jgi:spermidine/putrescine transport system substrate-binding protein